MAEDFDWKSGEPVPGTAADPAFDVDSFEMPDVTFGRDADEIAHDAAMREYKRIEPGEHELVVIGFKEAPQETYKTTYLGTEQVGYKPFKLAVRLAKASDPQAQILDFFELPPLDPAEQRAYLEGCKKPDGKNPGFMAEKFGFFIARLGWPYAKGAPLPREAKTLGNWKGRHIIGTVELRRPDKNEEVKIDPTTGEPYPPLPQIKLFSYKAVQQPGEQAAPAAQMGGPTAASTATGATASPTASGTTGRTAGQPKRSTDQLARAGVRDL
jgi:hypothetical protein